MLYVMADSIRPCYKKTMLFYLQIDQYNELDILPSVLKVPQQTPFTWLTVRDMG